MIEPYLLDGPISTPWWEALEALDLALAAGDASGAAAAHAATARALFGSGSSDLASALADALLFADGAWSEHVARAVQSAHAPLAAPGAALAARTDLQAYSSLARRDWQQQAEALVGKALPPWQDLSVGQSHSVSSEVAVGRLRSALLGGSLEEACAALAEPAASVGAGSLARHDACVWDGSRLRGVDDPGGATLASLIGVERQLAPLLANVEAFLTGRPALDTLLYGPRGSGKSTAVRGLLERYAERGLRLVEVPVSHLSGLPKVLAALARQPRPAVIMLDDLTFEEGDERLQPLRGLLEGSLVARSRRVLVVATSNRRHLVRERHGDRADPSADDVHAWDTHHDRLALADRFGLMITFPTADKRAYLRIVSSLANASGLEVDAALEERALRFAAWGNGYSGRTARQFVEREAAEASG